MRNETLMEKILHNWSIKTLSLAAAVLLFFFHRTATLEERFFSVPLQIETAEKFVIAGPFPRSVRITIRGRSEDIFVVLEEDIEAIVDLTAVSQEGMYNAPVKINKVGPSVQIDPLEIKIEPSSVTITLKEKTESDINIRHNEQEL